MWIEPVDCLAAIGSLWLRIQTTRGAAAGAAAPATIFSELE